ncbi:2-oxoglutarate dehydrogenase E1 subunit family protein, partial [Mycobacterium palustre]|uniref:2-oxoglutarate dehydrogenase E1 subunit family protein n=1 Tax=Mycobacterium palustre TaxID=153971 RepID=UPI0021F2DD10
MSNISSPFGQNEWLVEEMYRKFRDDPSSVDPSWHEFLVDYNPEPASDAAPASTTPGDGLAAAPGDGLPPAAPAPKAARA